MEKLNELAELIDAAIADALKDSEPTARECADAFIPAHEAELREHGFDLICRQVRAMFSARMKKVVEINAESGGQFELPFDIEGIPSAISFSAPTEDDPTRTRFIALSRATEWHLLEYQKILRANISAASSNLTAIEKLHRALAPTFEAYPGITVREACEQQKRGAA